MAAPCKYNDAINKIVSILKNLWGDLGDDVPVEGLEDRNVGSSQVSLNTSVSNKKQKKPVNKEKSASFNSAGMRTGAQKGSSKVVQP